MVERKEKTDEYNPTPSHALPAFRGGIIRGYVCPTCGHLEPTESKLFGLTCPMCFQKWAEMHIPQMISTKEAIEKDKEKDFALEPTKAITHNCQSHEFKIATTVKINKHVSTHKPDDQPDGSEKKEHPKQVKTYKTENSFPIKSENSFLKSIIYYIIGLF